jgi:AraC-like DNA-binding protein
MAGLVFEAHTLEGNPLPVIHHSFTIYDRLQETANWHENVELLFCTGGSGKVLCGGVPYSFAPGDLVAVSSNVIHLLGTEDWLQYEVLIVDTGFLEQSGLPVREVNFHTCIRDQRADAMFRDILEDLQATGPYADLCVRTAVLRLMVYLVRNHTTPDSAAQGAMDANIKRVIGFLLENYARKITLDQLADLAGLSKYHFTRVFKTATGMTVTAFVNRVRCRNARKLLLNRVPVNRAAVLCGFENPSYFARTFRKVIGCLPSQVCPPE